MTQIVKGTTPIPVNSIVLALYGQPGTKKSSMAQTADNPITNDFDDGLARAFGRKDSLGFVDLGNGNKRRMTWAEYVKAGTEGVYLNYSTIVHDTTGRQLDLMAQEIVAQSPKNGNRMGGLSLQGWGVLKSWFSQWTASMKISGKDVIYICHEKIEKKGEELYARPDIQGGSYEEVMKVADIIGYSHFENGKHVLNFNPTDQWMAKGPPQWAPFLIPDFAKEPKFLANIIADAKRIFSSVSEESAEIAALVEKWKAGVANINTLAQANDTMQDYFAIPEGIAKHQIKQLIFDACAKRLGWKFNKESKLWEAAV